MLPSVGDPPWTLPTRPARLSPLLPLPVPAVFPHHAIEEDDNDFFVLSNTDIDLLDVLYTILYAKI